MEGDKVEKSQPFPEPSSDCCSALQSCVLGGSLRGQRYGAAYLFIWAFFFFFTVKTCPSASGRPSSLKSAICAVRHWWIITISQRYDTFWLPSLSSHHLNQMQLLKSGERSSRGSLIKEAGVTKPAVLNFPSLPACFFLFQPCVFTGS